ncbi:glyoxalase [Streptomyces sp. 891-h]|uniref:glyoxalase n=1 Tax=Streptomyces sp. 891-h TaxID=2720714 RepID=UPI001FA95510|nr:glyoxalase [Streptomyces sp. 891-h]UNZ21321.1 glyoxalase [Streptomyces sp. 891-h]
MTESVIRASETTVPVLPCADAEETLAFYQALGFTVAYKQTRPYLYLALEWSGFGVHFGRPPKGHDPAREDGGCCLIMVDEVAPYHAAFTQAMRAAYGKVLAKGVPRLTRFRSGQTRFTLVDPSGNSLIFIQRDEPAELEYGGSEKLQGLARALDNARIFREFKNDDRAAFRAVSSALRRHGGTAPDLDRALALATLIELATVLNEQDHLDTWIGELEKIRLTEAERARVAAELGHVGDLTQWLAERGPQQERGGGSAQ